MSLDGLIELDGGRGTLRLRHDELGELVAEQLAAAGAIILGRRRHESWAETWPSQSWCSGHAIEPRSRSSLKCPVEGRCLRAVEVEPSGLDLSEPFS